MNEFTQEDYKNILALISKAPITGQDALVVAVLQQKLSNLLTPLPKTAKDEKESSKVK